MILFGSVGLSIGLMLLGMFCMGTWPNLFKYRERELRKEHLFIIYSIVCFIFSIVVAFTMGSFGPELPNFIDNLHSGSSLRILSAFAGGVCVGLSNLFVVFSSELAGLAIAMPISNGLSIVGGTLLNYAVVPVSRFYLLMIGISLVVVALLFESGSIIQKQKDQSQGTKIGLSKFDELNVSTDDELIQSSDVYSAENECSRDESDRVDSKKKLRKGVIFGIISGFFGCLWSPLSTYAMEYKGEQGTLTAYTCFFFFCMGFMVAAVTSNIIFLHRPVDYKKPARVRELLQLDWKVYAIGVAAGIICGVGNLLNFIAGQSSGGFAVSFAIARANTVVSAVYGVILWKDFKDTGTLAKILFGLCIFFYVGGILCVALCME